MWDEKLETHYGWSGTPFWFPACNLSYYVDQDVVGFQWFGGRFAGSRPGGRCMYETKATFQGIKDSAIASFWPSDGADCGGKEAVDIHDPDQAQTRIANMENVENQWVIVAKKLLETASPHENSNPPKSGRTSAGERVCRHVGTTICWRSRRWVAAAPIDRNCLGEERCVQSNKADENAKISWRTWACRRVAEVCPRLFYCEISGQFQWFDDDWGCTTWVAQNTLQNAAQKQSFKTSLRLSAHCKHSIILQAFRVHDSRTNRGTVGIHPAWGTTWLSKWQTCWGAFSDNTTGVWQITACQCSNLDY